ncbi:MAG: FAD-dependent oxidoreductase [Desulfarculaceae bacterium]|nr:FAD-dependent oxidoreductase [Desulfarculaceae bacterium]
MMKRVVIIGCGFLGLNAAKTLGNKAGVEVVVIDRHNYHLFQPLLYQVATAGLNAVEIAAPVRSILSGYRNVRSGSIKLFQILPFLRFSSIHVRYWCFQSA